MFKFSSSLRVVAFAVPMFLAANSASAAVIAGNSNGSFSNLASCTVCSIVDTASNGNNTQLRWGSIFTSGSTLTAVDRSWNQSTFANDVILAELVWTNASTLGALTPDELRVNYNLSFNFTSPNAASDNETFNLQIFNSSGSGDNLFGLTMADLSNLSFALNGILVSDLKYTLAGGGGATFVNNNWYNPESNTSRMYITADFREVPEPASLGLLAAGFFGLGAVRRYRRRT